MVSQSKDYEHKSNVPILCLAKIVNSKMQDSELAKWIEDTKRFKLLEGEVLECISNTLDNFYHILIEVLINNQDVRNATIQVWEDKIYKKDIIFYQNVISDEGIDLKNSQDIAKFLDKLIDFLKKFSNPNNLLLEFILPKKLLDEDINLWKTSVGESLSSKYRFIHRFQERVVNYASYQQSWIANWQETYEGDNKLKRLGAVSLVLKSEDEKEHINRTTKAIITAFPISQTDIFNKLYEYGASIVISPSSVLNESELQAFNEWFLREFQEVKIEEIVEKINDFCVNNANSFKSKIVLVWDNPHRIPSKYEKTVEPSTPIGFEGYGF